MRSLFLAIFMAFSVCAFAEPESTGEVLYYHFDEGGSLLFKGDIARGMYDELSAKPVFVHGDVDFKAWRKEGKNIACYSRTDISEVQCVVGVANRASGAIDTAGPKTE